MGFKRIICDICKTEVNKAQTYHIGNGKRACKSHEGVTDKKDELQKKEAAEKLKQATAAEQRRMSRFSSHEDFQPGKLRCGVCRNSGLRSDAFFARVLIERSKAEQIYGTFNPFDSKHPGNQVRIAERCVFVLEKSKIVNILKFIHGDFKHILELVGFIGVCGPCCHAHGIDPMPKVEFEDLVKAAPWVEVFLKPVIDKLAHQEMAQEN